MSTKQAGPLPLPEEALEDFFEKALAAASKAEFSNCRAQIGAWTLDLHIGSGFQEKNWTAPLAISSTENEAEVSLYVWEESRRSTGFPPPPWGNRYVYSHRGDIQGYNHPEIQVAFSQHSRVLSLYHRTRRLGIFWTPSLASLPGYEWAAPMRWLINWIGLEKGFQLTHAGAVGFFWPAREVPESRPRRSPAGAPDGTSCPTTIAGSAPAIMSRRMPSTRRQSSSPTSRSICRIGTEWQGSAMRSRCSNSMS